MTYRGLPEHSVAFILEYVVECSAAQVTGRLGGLDVNHGDEQCMSSTFSLQVYSEKAEQ